MKTQTVHHQFFGTGHILEVKELVEQEGRMLYVQFQQDAIWVDECNVSYTFTPEQRIEAYQFALDYIRTSKFWKFVCPCLADWMYDNFKHDLADDEIEYLFPEFYAQKPVDVEPGDAWWGRSDNDLRIVALLTAIEMAESLTLKITTV